MKAEEFWNQKLGSSAYGTISFPNPQDWVFNCALNHFGNVEGKTILDIGFGNGKASLFFALHGANVLSVDLSEVAVNQLNEFCEFHDIGNIRAIKRSALDLNDLGRVDFVFGSMILHHVEPFDKFVVSLKNVLDENGKAFFWENNAHSRLLMWFRKYLVGRLWIPKHGDDEEFPLTPEEVSELRKYFNVEQKYPYMHFFRLLSPYLFKGHLLRLLVWLDSVVFRLPFARKYSYRQQLFLTKLQAERVMKGA